MSQTSQAAISKESSLPGKNEHWATRSMFFVAGFATATWASLVPYAKSNTDVNEGTLGLLLLCLGGGALIAMPIAGALTTRLGCKKILLASVTLFSIMLPTLVIIDSPALLALALILFGFGIGATDSAMNIQAIIVEKASGQPIMSGFHAFYSIGGIAGAGLMTLLLSFGLTPFQACIGCLALFIVLLFVARGGLLPYAHPPEGPIFALPRGAVLLLGIICFIVFLGEGTVLDWSAVFLTEHRNVPESLGGIGFACFATLMTVGRLLGDKTVAAFGPKSVVLWGAAAAILGILVSIYFTDWKITLLGYSLMGIGLANIVPIMFSAIGRQTSMPQSVAVPVKWSTKTGHRVRVFPVSVF